MVEVVLGGLDHAAGLELGLQSDVLILGQGMSMCSTFSTTAATSTGTVSTVTALSIRVRVSSFSEMRVRRSASSPISETKSLTVSRSMLSV